MKLLIAGWTEDISKSHWGAVVPYMKQVRLATVGWANLLIRTRAWCSSLASSMMAGVILAGRPAQLIMQQPTQQEQQ